VVIVGLKSGLNEDIDASRRVDFVCRRTRVANSGWIKLPLPNPPRFQVYNAETLGLEVAPPVDGGVLASDDGTVAALWVSCAYQPAPNQLASVFRGLPILEAGETCSCLPASTREDTYSAVLDRIPLCSLYSSPLCSRGALKTLHNTVFLPRFNTQATDRAGRARRRQADRRRGSHFRDTSETRPRHVRDTSESFPRHFRVTSETLPSHFRDTSEDGLHGVDTRDCPRRPARLDEIGRD